jgi:hypothetical protein
MRPYLKNNQNFKKRAGSADQIVEYLPSNHKTLNFQSCKQTNKKSIIWVIPYKLSHIETSYSTACNDLKNFVTSSIKNFECCYKERPFLYLVIAPCPGLFLESPRLQLLVLVSVFTTTMRVPQSRDLSTYIYSLSI